MDLRLLQYFVAVAEAEHIGRAAARLHISQSPLSRQIRQLEKQLGLELFIRERQRIRLTDAGRWLLEEARNLLAHAEKIRSEAAQRALGKLGTVSVSFVSSAMWSGVLPDMLRRFRAEFPDAAVELRNMNSARQAQAVEHGSIDLGFVAIAPRSAALEAVCVSEARYMIAAAASHPILRKRTITSRDVSNERWIVLSGALAPRARAELLASCAQTGFLPATVQEVFEPNTLLAWVDAGFGVGLMPEHARFAAPKSVKFRPLPWFPLKARIFLIRRKNRRSQLADAFAAYAPAVSSS